MSVLEVIRASRRERAIEDLLYAYPGLIEPGLWHPKRQLVLAANSRSDLLFELENRVVIVEIKRDTISVGAVRQIERYARNLGRSTSCITGYLIAPKINPKAERAIAASSYHLRFLSLDVDIPTRIKVCRQCRRPYDEKEDRCPSDGTRITI